MRAAHQHASNMSIRLTTHLSSLGVMAMIQSISNSKQLQLDIPEPIQEVWRQIADYPDYAVSNMGQVKRLTAAKCRRRYPVGMVLKPSPQKNGYTTVTLWGQNKKRRMY